jgi:hypothetical protein
MAGKRQHYIPKFLQRGFLAENSNDSERTWLYRRGAPAKLVGIRDVGVGEHFYSSASTDGLPTLDDQITAIEGSIYATLEDIKAGDVNSAVESSIAALLLTHLVIRTAHVRSTFTRGAMMVLDHVADYVGSTDGMREELGIDESSGGRLSAAIEQVLSTLPTGALSLPPDFAERALTFFVRERFEELYEQTKPQLTQAISMCMEGVSKAIDDAHRRALLDADFRERERALSAFSWRTKGVSEAVLPDCIAVAREFGGTYVPLLLSDLDAVDCVVLPLSHDLLLVGSKGRDGEVSAATANEACAACSDNFFISKSSDHGEYLSSLIGQRCAQTISAQVRDAVSKRTSLRTSEDELPAKKGSTSTETIEAPFSFTLTCLGVDDQEAATLSEIIKLVVREMSRTMPLAKLDGMTFASDYASAVEMLDRGDKTLAPERSQPREYGRPVAKCVTVARHEMRKEHIVFDAIIARDLLDEDSEEHDSALHIVIKMLSHVAHESLFEEKLIGKMLVPPDAISGLVCQCISSVPMMYYTAMQSAFADPGAGDRYARLTMDSYNSARTAIRIARSAYRNDGNLDALLVVALQKIGFVLEHGAEWCGHRDGLPSQDEFPGKTLVDDLKSLDLDRWLELFANDLRRLYSSEEQLSAQNIFALGRHAERLLWTFQICPWHMSDGRIYVSVPTPDDEAVQTRE